METKYGMTKTTTVLFMNLTDFNVIKEKTLEYPADKRIDIAIEIDDIRKDFTFEDFKKRLGFI